MLIKQLSWERDLLLYKEKNCFEKLCVSCQMTLLVRDRAASRTSNKLKGKLPFSEVLYYCQLTVSRLYL
jgi:hypothetical protein